MSKKISNIKINPCLQYIPRNRNGISSKSASESDISEGNMPCIILDDNGSEF
jgi:hypothetical protein